MSGNISHYHYVQNKGAYSPLSETQIRWNNDLHEKKYSNLVDFNPVPFFEHPEAISFNLKTTYPGLLVGSGYAHPALYKPNKKDQDDKGDYQLGLFLDHTTGLPVIPGSSVKGVLKSVFPSEIKNNYSPGKKEFIESKNKNKLEYINTIISKIQKPVTIDKPVIIDITNENWENVFFGRKQVFLDAYLFNVEDNLITSNGKEKHLFADDYITPHTAGIFKEPNPIRFLKVAPNVTFTFQFLLKDYIQDKIILEAVEILKIFKEIIIDFGVGAKRNVNYGQFVEPYK